MSQITTHVLDTSIGKPGEGISIELQEQKNNDWQTIAKGVTNEDGRIADLLNQDKVLKPDTYRMVFHTGNYFANNNQKAFYPIVIIHFQTTDASHYHIPLLLNPFGYTTYRGS